ncbi:MAG: ABC transporter ATP-binding protein [Thermoleophilia bacterium]
MNRQYSRKGTANLVDERLLQVSNLTIARKGGAGSHVVLRGISFEVKPGMVLGIVGESGAGKTSLALALMGLLDMGSVEVSGEINFHGQNLASMEDDELCRVRGSGIGMIFQDSSGALDPSMKVLDQVAEAVVLNRGVKRAEARRIALDILAGTNVDAEILAVAPYAFQLSGGLCQRSMVAAALAGEPELLVADEPTSSLDVTLQAQIISLLNARRLSTGMAIVFISHDLALVSSFADEILVIHGGEVVEHGSCAEVLVKPMHEYTRELITAWDDGQAGGGANHASH